MNEKLKELYYQDDVIIGSKQNFINITKKSLNASTKEINDFLKNQEINQVNKNRINILIKKITALPRTYQIDIMYYPIGENFRNVLLIVDIQSRKAWAYVISSTSGETILKAYKKFESEVNIINAIEGDNQFSFKAFQEYNKEKNPLCCSPPGMKMGSDSLGQLMSFPYKPRSGRVINGDEPELSSGMEIRRRGCN